MKRMPISGSNQPMHCICDISNRIDAKPLSGWLAGMLIAALFQILVGFSPFVPAAHSADNSKNRFFRGLENGLQLYQRIASQSGWKLIPSGPVMKPGMSDMRVPMLRQRLSITEDFIGNPSNDPRYDEELVEAVVNFQNRNGQEPDGVIGKDTLATLNIPVEQRIKQIKINIERWRRMPPSLGKRFVLVNMAGFELDVIEGDRTVLEMRVVVGKIYHKTPMFSDLIRFVEINPYWNAPQSIANNELVQSFAADLAKAVSDGYEIVRDGQSTPVTSVDWHSLSGKTVPFLIRQRPGPKNVLGKFKFLFPNEYNVYLHDTNAKGLFSKTVRSFSHGCVRIQQPEALANYLLKNNGDWPPERVAAAVESGKNIRVTLAKPVPVHMAYMTTWQDKRGFLQFRPDIYGRDAELVKEL